MNVTRNLNIGLLGLAWIRPYHMCYVDGCVTKISEECVLLYIYTVVGYLSRLQKKTIFQSFYFKILQLIDSMCYLLFLCNRL